MLGLGTQAGPIGVDLGTSAVKLVQLDRRGPAPSVVAAGWASMPASTPVDDADPMPSSASIAEAVLEAMRGTGFQGRRAVVGLPPGAMLYKNLRLPPMPPAELAEAVQWEGRDRLSLREDEATIQFYDAGLVEQGGESKREVILLAARRAWVDRVVEAMNTVGLRLQRIDAAPAALNRASRPAQQPASTDDPADGSMLFTVDVGATATQVMIGRVDQPLFFRQLPFGGRVLDQAVAASLGVSTDSARRARLERGAEAGGDESASTASAAPGDGGATAASAVRAAVDETARELSLCLRYVGVTFRGERPSRMRLTGGEGDCPMLRSALQDAVGVRVDLLDPAEGFAQSNRLDAARGGRGAFTEAIGLARHPVTSRLARRRGSGAAA